MTPAETIALKPCPFCGDAPQVSGGNHIRESVVFCANTECRAIASVQDMDAVRIWNTRAEDAAVRRLTKAIEDAPHDERCNWHARDILGPDSCSCWKSTALASLTQPESGEL